MSLYDDLNRFKKLVDTLSDLNDLYVWVRISERR